jgi:hypothetical protein
MSIVFQSLSVSQYPAFYLHASLPACQSHYVLCQMRLVKQKMARYMNADYADLCFIYDFCNAHELAAER